MKNKILFLTLILCLLLSSFVSAEVVNTPNCDSVNSIITITGNIDEGNMYDRVVISVLKPGKTPSDLISNKTEDINNVYEGISQTYLDENKNYKIKLKIKGSAGWYKILVNHKSLSEPFIYDYFFATLHDKEVKAEEIKNAKDENELKTILDITNEESVALLTFGIKYDNIKDLDKDSLTKIIFDLNKENVPSDKNVDNVFINISNAVVIEKIKEGKITDITPYFKDLKSDEKFIELYENKLNDTYRNKTLENIITDNPTDLKSFSDSFNKSTLLSFINMKESWNTPIYVVENFSDYLELDKGFLNKYERIEDYGKLSDSLKYNYNNLSEFKDDLKENVRKCITDNNSYDKRPSASGGGGGGSFGKTPAITTPPVIPEITLKEFQDVSKDHWAYKSIMNLYDKGIINGVSDDIFSPDSNVKREEFVKMISVAFKIGGGNDIEFTDVDKNSWYYPYIKGAYNKGIIKGESKESFGVGRELKRADASLILFNILDIEPIKSEAFKDDNDIPLYAKEAVYTLKEMGILKGNTDGMFEPERPLTRAECAHIINKVLEVK